MLSRKSGPRGQSFLLPGTVTTLRNSADFALVMPRRSQPSGHLSNRSLPVPRHTGRLIVSGKSRGYMTIVCLLSKYAARFLFFINRIGREGHQIKLSERSGISKNAD
jgi:hypothetical protein